MEVKMLNNTLIERILLTALSNGASFAEIFMEDTYHSNIKLLDNKIKDSIVGQDYGAGIRVFYGKKAIYAYTNDLSEKSLISAAKAVSKAETGHNNITEIKLINKQINLFSFDKPISGFHPLKTLGLKISTQNI